MEVFLSPSVALIPKYLRQQLPPGVAPDSLVDGQPVNVLPKHVVIEAEGAAVSNSGVRDRAE